MLVAMFYAPSPKKTGLPREVLKWLQTLELTFFPKNVRRDVSNGYVIAEIFSWYYPEDFTMHSFNNGASLLIKQGNWDHIASLLLKHRIMLDKGTVDGTIHCKPGAAEVLVQDIYATLTNKKFTQKDDKRFTDQNYQRQLPMMARSTASKAIKNNVKLTELMAEPCIVTQQRKVQAIINMHLEQRKEERAQNPNPSALKDTSNTNITFKEIKVRQSNRRSLSSS